VPIPESLDIWKRDFHSTLSHSFFDQRPRLPGPMVGGPM
jgi:hypothetical protein